MLKYLILSVLLTMRAPSFSQENSTTHCSPMEKEDLITFYLYCGNDHLSEKNFRAALENFEKATRINNQLEDSVAYGLFISFGKIVAFDNLGMRSKCQQELGALFIACFEALADLELSQTQEPFDPDDLDFMEDMRELASLAPTLGVRLILYKIVDTMHEQIPNCY